MGLRSQYRFAAPDLLMAECSNVLWKKVRRGELVRDEAILASRLLERADVELFSMRGLTEATTSLAVELGHPAYDCSCLALAHKRQSRFVTADRRFLQLVGRIKPGHAELCVPLERLSHRP
ncbi:MAG: type II toxin-antitoxin system VapC family toxin [Parvibaculaceae bacterium]